MESLCNGNKVVVLGSTGLIGNHLTRLLVNQSDIAQITTPGRNIITDFDHPKLNKIILEMDRLDEYGEIFRDASAVFCCLGTTMRQAKNREAFRRVDFDYPLLAAKAAHARGVKHFLLVSAQGASAKSPFFYSQVKGRLEEVIRQIPFERITIIRPGLLLGRKSGQRPMEDMAGWIMRGLRPLWRGSLEKFAAVKGSDIAVALIQSYQAPVEATHYHGYEILEFKR